VEPTSLRTLEPGEAPTDTSTDAWEAYRKEVVIDAERAFVHLMDPQYNVTKFASYPKSVDGLYGQGHTRYGFLIAENLTFKSGTLIMRGSWNPRLGVLDNHADRITVTGHVVEMFAVHAPESRTGDAEK